MQTNKALQRLKLKETTRNKALPADRELEMLRQQRIRFDGYFTGPTW